MTKYSVFSISGSLYALEMSKVREVLKSPRVARLPNAASHILGVYNVRGRIITLIDIRKILGIEPAENEKTALVLLIGMNGSMISFFVDKIHDFIEIDAEKIHTSPVKKRNTNTAYVQGGYEHDKLGTLNFLDAERLITLN